MQNHQQCSNWANTRQSYCFITARVKYWPNINAKKWGTDTMLKRRKKGQLTKWFGSHPLLDPLQNNKGGQIVMVRRQYLFSCLCKTINPPLRIWPLIGGDAYLPLLSLNDSPSTAAYITTTQRLAGGKVGGRGGGGLTTVINRRAAPNLGKWDNLSQHHSLCVFIINSY